MKAVILAGGLGTRISEETNLKPKPMIEIGGKPILWHIMKIFFSQGISEFIICCGYKGYVIKEYFLNYSLHNSDIVITHKNNKIQYLNTNVEDWKVACIDTGKDTQTGGRLKRVSEYLNDNEDFLFTYGDGVCDISIDKLLKSHSKAGKLVTVTAVNPPGRFGTISIHENGIVSAFEEKPAKGDSWINGGFFVVNKKAIDYISGDHMPWEHDPLINICKQNQLNSYKHEGFWQPMDTLRDKNFLNELIAKKSAPWVTW